MMAHEFALVRRILKEHSGLNLGEDKQDLLEGKLRPLLREFSLPTLSHLVLAMMKPDAHRLCSRVAQAVTVQESYFFRDKLPFSYFVDVMLPKLMAKRETERRIRVWCAATATGQEPYSLAMELAEADSKLAGWTVEIVATDFVEDALSKARKGFYNQFQVQRGLPLSLLVNISTRSASLGRSAPISWPGRFRTHNLLDDWRDARDLRRDLLPERADLFRRGHQARRALPGLLRRLAADGYLVLGAAETTTGLSDEFMAVPERHHGLFRFTPQAAEAAEARCRKVGADGAGSAARRLALRA